MNERIDTTNMFDNECRDKIDALTNILDIQRAEIEKLKLELHDVQRALGKAAMEINVAGPVDHRIRILRSELMGDIWKLQAENEQLRQALKPFAAVAHEVEAATDPKTLRLTIQDFRNARKMLEENEVKNGR